MHSNEDKKESVERAERLQGEHRARASQLDRNWAPSVLLALLAKAPGPTLSPLPDPPRENTRRVRCPDSVPYKPGTYIKGSHRLKYSITFNLCGTHAHWSFAPGGKPVPPLVRYHSLPDGSYAVGRRRALHQHQSVHALFHLPA